MSDIQDKEVILYSRSEILKVLRDLNTIVVSLDRIGSIEAHIENYKDTHFLSDFIEEWKVLRRLANARQILSEPFSTELGEDDMDELEREMQDVPYWSFSKQEPQTLLILYSVLNC